MALRHCFQTGTQNNFKLKGVFEFYESFGVSGEKKQEIYNEWKEKSEIPKPEDLNLEKTEVGSDGAKGLVEFIDKHVPNAFPGNSSVESRLKLLAWIHMEDETSQKINTLNATDHVEIVDGLVKIYRNNEPSASIVTSLYPWKELKEVTSEGKYEVIDSRDQKYYGEIHNEEESGHGVHEFLEESGWDGDVFFGEFTRGSADGLGTYKTSDGSIYIGEFEGMYYEGEGVRFNPDGTIEQGIWKEDKLTEVKKDEDYSELIAQAKIAMEKAVAAAKKAGWAGEAPTIPEYKRTEGAASVGAGEQGVQERTKEDKSETSSKEPAAERVEQRTSEELQNEAIQRNTESVEKGADYTRSLREEMWDTLNGNEKVTLPDALKGMSNLNYAQEFKYMDGGTQLLEALSKMSDLTNGTLGPIDIWNKARRAHLEPDKIRVSEFCGVVMGMRPDRLERRFNGSKASEAEKARIQAFLQALAEIMAVLKKDEALGQHSFEENTDKTVDHPEEGLADFVIAHNTLDNLFPEDLYQNPEFRGPRKGYATMESFKGHFDDIDFTADYAKAVLGGKLTGWSTEGKQVFGDKEKAAFISKLNELRRDGLIALADPSLDSKMTTQLTWESLKNLSTEDTTLIREGMLLQMTRRKVEQEQRAKELQELSDANPLDKTLKEMFKEGELTADDQTAVVEGVKSLYIGTLWTGHSFDTGSTGFGGDLMIPISRDRKFAIHIGASTNPFTDGGEISHDFAIHAGVGGVLHEGPKKRFVLRFDAGAQVKPVEGAPLSVGAGLAMEQRLGKDDGITKLGDTFSFTVRLGAGMGVTPEAYFAGVYAALGFKRNMGAVVERKTEAAMEEKKDQMEKAKAEFTKGMGPEEKAAFEQELMALYKRETGNEVIHDLKAIQFTGFEVGVATVPHPPFVLPTGAFLIGFKGRVYSIYRHQNSQGTLSASEEMQFRDSLAKSVGATEALAVPVSAGEATTDLSKEGQDALLAQDLKLEAQEGKPGVYRLDVFNTEGNVDIYTDPKGGIRTFVGEDGYVYLELTEEDTRVSIKRVDRYSPLQSFGSNQTTEIFISNNEQASHTGIKAGTSEFIHYVDSGELHTKAEIIKSHLVGDGLEDSSFKEAELSADLQAYAEKVAQLKSTLQAKATEGRTETRSFNGPDEYHFVEDIKLAQYRAQASEAMKDSTFQVEFKKLTRTEEFNEGKVKELVRTKMEFSSDEEFYAALQALSEATLRDMTSGWDEMTEKERQEKMQGILEWSSKEWAKVLVESGIDAAKAPLLAQQMLSLAANEFQKNGDGTAIEKGAGFGVQAYSDKIGGTQRFMSNNDGTIMGGMNLLDKVDFIRKMSPISQIDASLTEADFEAVRQALLKRSDFLPEDFFDPEKLFESKVGHSVLESAPVVFDFSYGAEGAKHKQNVEEYLKNPSEFDWTTEEHQATLAILTEMAQSLAEKQTWTSPDGNATVNLFDQQFVGSYDKCLNPMQVFGLGKGPRINIILKVPGEVPGEPGQPNEPGEPGKELLRKTFVTAGAESHEIIARYNQVQIIMGGLAATFEPPVKPETPPTPIIGQPDEGGTSGQNPGGSNPGDQTPGTGGGSGQNPGGSDPGDGGGQTSPRG